ncbi:flagellar hook-basal body protein [Variovorax sp. CF313]|jgi:flagellar basal-body rod protein FlgG|uniref:flagellar hook-basal body protein n=1 Tax=unclassified Variovorax TaxID=663243 RepID=UPI0002714DE0|nr:flagellar hook-basal body protein [Variovorax sp. CF313]EJL72202.1 flagellar hook-basal body protein [Variovorax sp. CF313]
MSDVLAITLNGMQQDMARVERVSMNMANATTPGYKREVASSLPVGATAFADAMRGVDAARGAARSTSPGLPSASLAAAGSLLIQTDDRAGTLKTTGQNLDVALATPGFFEVSTDAGLGYTRLGSWQLDGRGRLVTAQGNPVMGIGGEIVLTRPNPVIDASGQVFESKPGGGTEATPVGQLKVVRFDKGSNLEHLGNGLLRTDAAPLQLTDAEIQLRQGFIENSNVNSMQEMTQLIQSMRHFESMQRVALGYDEMIGGAVRKLGDLS